MTAEARNHPNTLSPDPSEVLFTTDKPAKNWNTLYRPATPGAKCTTWHKSPVKIEIPPWQPASPTDTQRTHAFEQLDQHSSQQHSCPVGERVHHHLSTSKVPYYSQATPKMGTMEAAVQPNTPIRANTQAPPAHKVTSTFAPWVLAPSPLATSRVLLNTCHPYCTTCTSKNTSCTHLTNDSAQTLWETIPIDTTIKSIKIKK